MSEVFNSLLIITMLVILFLCIEKKKKDDDDIVMMQIDSKNKDVPTNHNNIYKEDFVNTDKIYLDYPYVMNDFANSEKKTEKIKFNYNIRPVDKEFLKEQEKGVNYNTWYPNTWVQKVVDGKPIYNSRENVTGKKEELVEEHTRMTYDFNAPKSIAMDGTIACEAVGTKISDVYDNYFVDYKKLTPPKKVLEEEAVSRGASNLFFYAPDTWTYADEKPENGGKMELPGSDGLFGADLGNLDPTAKYMDNMNAF